MKYLAAILLVAFFAVAMAAEKESTNGAQNKPETKAKRGAFGYAYSPYAYDAYSPYAYPYSAYSAYGAYGASPYAYSAHYPYSGYPYAYSGYPSYYSSPSFYR